MEKLNSYLQQLLNKCGYELRLEPNKNPYILTTNGKLEVSSNALPGTQINSMIFTLIPDHVKKQLPNQPEIEFVHPHTLGAFTFCVRKSPAGFNVTISPAGENKESAPVAVSTENAVNTAPEIEQTSQEQSAFEAPVAEEKPVFDASAESEVSSDAEETVMANDGLSSDEYEPDEYPGSADYQREYVSDPSALSSETDDFEIEYLDTSDENELQAEVTPVIEGAVSVTSNIDDSTSPNQTAGFEQNRFDSSSSHSDQHNPLPAADQDSGEDIVNSSQNFASDYAQPITSTAQQNNFTPANPNARAEMDALFVKMAEVGASDLHLSVSVPPMIRMDGKMRELVPNAPAVSQEHMKSLLTSIMPEKNIGEFEERNDTDFAYEIKGLARFRANVFRDRKGMGGVFRIIPSKILTAEDLNLSNAIMKLCELSKGLVVVTGPTGSGKSTTLCAMVDWINKNREEHLITIEDPIEFTHENNKCLVNQREVHNHTNSFKNALRAALREDPDILLVGEMRDLETISIAIETAETGHLVFGTLHTTTAASTVDRIIDQFPADRQQQIRVMLSESLRGVIAQTLLPKVGGGRIAALEVLVVTPAIANLIREGKTFQIPSQMQTGKNLGMTMLNDSLMDLVNKGLVTPKDAYVKAVDKDGFEMQLQRNGKKI